MFKLARIAQTMDPMMIAYFGTAKQECATVHQSGKNKGFVRVNKINAFSRPSKIPAKIPKMAKIYPESLHLEPASHFLAIIKAKLNINEP